MGGHVAGLEMHGRMYAWMGGHEHSTASVCQLVTIALAPVTKFDLDPTACLLASTICLEPITVVLFSNLRTGLLPSL
jgi:hypothetical protein